MNLSSIPIAGFLIFSVVQVVAQEAPIKFIGLETGLSYTLDGKMVNGDRIRPYISAYGPYNSSTNLSITTDRSYIGIRFEKFSASRKWGFSGGLRFSRTNSVTNFSPSWPNPDYFYWLYRQDGINTEYLKVKEINQVSDYLGIPIEVRFFPFHPRRFRLYFKVGAELNFRIQTKTKVKFADNTIQPYESELATEIGKPQFFNPSVYGAVGLRVGKQLYPINLELVPYLFIKPESTGLASSTIAPGFQISVQIPIRAKSK